jgi:hypothetical protein
LWSIGPPFGGFFGRVHRCSEWPAHWLHKYYSILMWLPEPSSIMAIMAAEFCLRNISIHARKVLLHSVNLRHGTDGFTSPPKEVVLPIFITLYPSAGIEPANLGSSSEHANH